MAAVGHRPKAYRGIFDSDPPLPYLRLKPRASDEPRPTHTTCLPIANNILTTPLLESFTTTTPPAWYLCLSLVPAAYFPPPTPASVVGETFQKDSRLQSYSIQQSHSLTIIETRHNPQFYIYPNLQSHSHHSTDLTSRLVCTGIIHSPSYVPHTSRFILCSITYSPPHCTLLTATPHHIQL